MNAYLNATRRYATFSSRTSRQEFWRAHIVVLPLMIVAVWPLVSPEAGRSAGPSLVCALIGMPHILPWATPVGRRVDDMGRTGWWVLVGLILLVVVPPLGLITLLAWGVLRGTPGSNHYSPDTVDASSVIRSDRAVTPIDQALTGSSTASKTLDLITDLERLSTLRASGTLTAAEFAVMKAKAFGQGKAAR